jgi:hypothetical protein
MPPEGPIQLPELLIMSCEPTLTNPPIVTLALILAVPVIVAVASGVILLKPTLLLVASTNNTPLSKLELPPKLETLPERVTLECVEFPVTTKVFAKPGLTINVPLTVAVFVTIKLAVVTVLEMPIDKTLALLA